MKAIMVDLETLGSNPSSPILVIAAVGFESDGEPGGDGHVFDEEFIEYVDFESAVANGRPDGETIKWWLQQSDAARTRLTDPVGHSLRTALDRFVDWTRATRPHEVWANSPSFDLVILGTAMRRLGVNPPWTYLQHRDVRTLAALRRDVLAPSPKVSHDALDDARAQAIHVQRLMRALAPHEEN